MHIYMLSILVLCGGTLSCLILAGQRRFAAASNTVGAVFAVAGGGAAAAAGLGGLLGQTWDLAMPWAVPGGSLHVAMDRLSGLFVMAIGLVGGVAGLYGRGYLADHRGRGSVAGSWSFYLLLLASMVVVVTSRNAVLFLVAWEAMSLTSFFLVVFEADRPGVIQAGWTYLVATHLGTGFLVVMFLVLGHGESMEFANFAAGGLSTATASAVFLLAVVGFGAKAGFMPVHVWLPEAHPAAPSHVSAVMSGVMIKTGIYGLVRVLGLLPTDLAWPAWWGWTLVIVGAVSGIVGVLLALAQQDLKRLLAYSSVENIGVIALGLGVGLVGRSSGNEAMAVLGFSGALLHVLNHSIFKGLLFLGAGSVLHATHSVDMDKLGGLAKRMPATAATFLVASAAVCALPPLNGFVSEFCIYLGSLHGIIAGGSAWAGVWAVAALAMIGALAAACFAKAFAGVFLGEPRTEYAAGESAGTMRWSMWTLAGLCVVLGLAGPVVAPMVAIAAGELTRPAGGVASASHADLFRPLWPVTVAAGVLGAILVGLVIARRRLLAGRTIARAGTWDCGYAVPSARMQYTATSFAMPIITMFRYLLWPMERIDRPAGLLPDSASAHTQTADPFTRSVFRPAFAGVAWIGARLRWMQQGHNQLYILYIALALLVLLGWKLAAT